MNVYLKCRKCGHQNHIEGVPASRVDLAMFRGSEEPVNCNNCGKGMDTMTAYCGDQVGPDIVRREDPKF